MSTNPDTDDRLACQTILREALLPDGDVTWQTQSVKGMIQEFSRECPTGKAKSMALGVVRWLEEKEHKIGAFSHGVKNGYIWDEALGRVVVDAPGLGWERLREEFGSMKSLNEHEYKRRCRLIDRALERESHVIEQWGNKYACVPESDPRFIWRVFWADRQQNPERWADG